MPREIVGTGLAQETEAFGENFEKALGVQRTSPFDLRLQDLIDQVRFARLRGLFDPELRGHVA